MRESKGPPRYSWLVKQPDGVYTFDRETTLAILGDENPNDIPAPELHKRMAIVSDLNGGYLQLPPEPEASLLSDQKKAWDKLRNIMVVTANPYQADRGVLMIYRMRLFTAGERRILRGALRKKIVRSDGTITDSGWECVEGGAGMMDELEMVNFETGGKKIKDLRRLI